MKGFAVSGLARHWQLVLYLCLLCLFNRRRDTQFLISIKPMLLHSFAIGRMLFGFTAWGYGLAGSSVRLRATFLAFIGRPF